jgi:hypothetical protein
MSAKSGADPKLRDGNEESREVCRFPLNGLTQNRRIETANETNETLKELFSDESQVRRVGDVVLCKVENDEHGFIWNCAFITAYNREFMISRDDVTFFAMPDLQETISQMAVDGYEMWSITIDEHALISPALIPQGDWIDGAYSPTLPHRSKSIMADCLKVIYKDLRDRKPGTIADHRDADPQAVCAILRTSIPEAFVRKNWPKPDPDEMYTYFGKDGLRWDFYDRDCDRFNVVVYEPRPGRVFAWHDGYASARHFTKQKLCFLMAGSSSAIKFKEYIPGIESAESVRSKLLPRAYDVVIGRTGVRAMGHDDPAIDEIMEIIAEVTGYGRISMQPYPGDSEMASAVLESIGAVSGVAVFGETGGFGYGLTPEETKRVLALSPEKQPGEMAKIMRRLEQRINDKENRKRPRD